MSKKSESFDFINDMSEQEAYDKHAQLKSLLSVTRSLLLEIRDRKGYLALGFSSFEEYGEKEWGYTRTYINRLANAEQVQKTLSVPMGTELPERQLRELAKVPESERQAIYDQAKADAAAENKEMTAKLIREKAEAQAQAKHLENLNQHQSKDISRIVKEHGSLVDEFNILESNFNKKAAEIAVEIATEKVAEKQKELQANLDDIVAKVHADYQQTIDTQKDKISRLENNLAKNSTASATTEADSQYLSELQQQIIESKAALHQLEIDKKDDHAARKANHAYIGLTLALCRDVNDHIEAMQAISSLLDDNGNIIPLHHIPESSKDTLLEGARVLRVCAKLIETLANYTEVN